MHHVFKKITDAGNKWRQDKEVEFRINIVDFKRSGDEQA
ncbi:hypothetical protein ASZ90_006956 [hydrocarbon metagenome]|uniref:Uncharacterized protein n=1 Tax=hydrocarbon metagenome TaxID=938273 RepID=A0A0W8FQT4_9ZZZZ